MTSAIRFGSVCSGIEAASVAWHPLGWRAAWLAEIEPFPSAVLAHHYPYTPNLGDMTRIARLVLQGDVEAPDVLTGGTPCQAFSVAGLRESLADARGNLTLKFVELADAIDLVRGRAGKPASVVIWENVPGVLSTKDNAFGCFLAGLAGEDEPLQPPGQRWENAGCVYGPQRAIAWRTLDAQYFGLAQRRRRVFVVASARDGFDPAQVLFEWDGVRRDLAPSRGQAEDAAGTLAGGARQRGGYSHDDTPIVGTLTGNHKGDNIGHESKLVTGTLLANGKAAGSATQQDAESGMLVTHSLRGEGFDASEDGTGRGTPLVPVAGAILKDSFSGGAGGRPEGAAVGHFIAFDCKASGQNGFGIGDIASTQRAMGHAGSHTNGGGHQAALVGAQVRRLMPMECERLQGFADTYTEIPWRRRSAEECPDGPRYKALGNSWAVPVARWVGKRVHQHLEAA